MAMPPAATATPGAAAQASYGHSHATKTTTHIDPLNNSGVRGSGQVVVKMSGDRINVTIKARGLLKNMPHAMHIHYGPKATHECPTVKRDTNRDHRLNVVEGIPSYGPIAVSLTTKGDTSPKSALAVERFNTAPKGKLVYQRYNIKVSKKTAAAIKAGEAVVVIHGLDYNQNGKYDFNGAGKSELNPAVPAEATDPAACGVLHRH
jgi:hypothetical protein